MIEAEHANDHREIYTVSRLNREVNELLAAQFGVVWVEGELSNLARPASGHIYFSLKDNQAQVRCAMFRSRNTLLRFNPEEGLAVLAQCRVGMYEARGDYQLIVAHMEPQGEGLLRLNFEKLKRELAAAGLFDAARKREVPLFPERVGVVTSASGAAIRDILTVISRRNPAIEVVVYPTAVQGAQAAPQIVAALQTANRRSEVDVVILARGGGSLEDLWSFNEEIVARAIYASALPVVTGVGHEIDFTIADLVADYRAATPSAAAEVCSPHRDAITARLTTLATQIATAVAREIKTQGQHLRFLHSRIEHPGKRIEQCYQRVDQLARRLPDWVRIFIQIRGARLETVGARLMAANPRRKCVLAAETLARLRQQLEAAARRKLAERKARLAEATRALRAVGPQATLERGYAIVTDAAGNIARDAAGFSLGEKIEARLAQGSLGLEVESIHLEGGDQ